MNPVPLNRTLEQELNALLRGASMECLVCGEFVMQLPHSEGIFCPECGSGGGTDGAPRPPRRARRAGQPIRWKMKANSVPPARDFSSIDPRAFA